jgi:hypothetical protein
LFNDLQGFWAIFLEPGLSKNKVRWAGDVGNTKGMLIESVAVTDWEDYTVCYGEYVGVIDRSKVDWRVEQEGGHEVATSEFINKFFHC